MNKLLAVPMNKVIRPTSPEWDSFASIVKTQYNQIFNAMNALKIASVKYPALEEVKTDLELSHTENGALHFIQHKTAKLPRCSPIILDYSQQCFGEILYDCLLYEYCGALYYSQVAVGSCPPPPRSIILQPFEYYWNRMRLSEGFVSTSLDSIVNHYGLKPDKFNPKIPEDFFTKHENDTIINESQDN